MMKVLFILMVSVAAGSSADIVVPRYNKILSRDIVIRDNQENFASQVLLARGACVGKACIPKRKDEQKKESPSSSRAAQQEQAHKSSEKETTGMRWSLQPNLGRTTSRIKPSPSPSTSSAASQTKVKQFLARVNSEASMTSQKSTVSLQHVNPSLWRTQPIYGSSRSLNRMGSSAAPSRVNSGTDIHATQPLPNMRRLGSRTGATTPSSSAENLGRTTTPSTGDSTINSESGIIEAGPRRTSSRSQSRRLIQWPDSPVGSSTHIPYTPSVYSRRRTPEKGSVTLNSQTDNARSSFQKANRQIQRASGISWDQGRRLMDSEGWVMDTPSDI